MAIKLPVHLPMTKPAITPQITAPRPAPPPVWTLQGTTGADTLTGTANNDRIYGDAGNDTISGLAGNDIINGGAGTNRLTGGAGADLFVVDKRTATAGATTTITDFKVSEKDHLALVGFGPSKLYTTAAAAQANGGVHQHVVTVSGAQALELDVYAKGATTAAHVVVLVGVTATVTEANLYGMPFGPFHH